MTIFLKKGGDSIEGTKLYMGRHNSRKYGSYLFHLMAMTGA